MEVPIDASSGADSFGKCAHGFCDCLSDCATLYTYDPIHGRSLQEAKLPQVERVQHECLVVLICVEDENDWLVLCIVMQ